MIYAAIVEDDEKSAELLCQYLKRYEQAAEEEFRVALFQNAVNFLEPYRKFDLVFMDIQLPHINGMEAAARMRKIDAGAKLIFVTNMAQYAVKGYEVDALDFIVKPVSYSDFSFKMKRAVSAVKLCRKKELIISLPSGMACISSDELKYVEVRGHNLTYHLNNGQIVARGTMANAEEQLAAWSFLRCNNCYLVNPRYIDWVKGYIVKVDGEELQISHPRKKKFMEDLSSWYLKGGG